MDRGKACLDDCGDRRIIARFDQPWGLHLQGRIWRNMSLPVSVDLFSPLPGVNDLKRIGEDRK